MSAKLPSVSQVQTDCGAPAKWTSDMLLDRLRARCAPPAHAFFPEFRSATGAHARSLDALSVSLFASRGLEVHGYEIKVDRADLKRELADPEKAEAVAKFCDRFWLVVPDVEVVGDHLADELPDPWGWLVASGEGLRQVRKAKPLPGLPTGRVRDFVASLARRASEDVVPRRDVNRIVHEESLKIQARERAWQSSQKDHRYETAAAALEAERAIRKRFEDAVGEHLHHWNIDRVGHALRVHLEGGDARERVEAFAKGAVRSLDEARAALVRLLPETKEAPK